MSCIHIYLRAAVGSSRTAVVVGRGQATRDVEGFDIAQAISHLEDPENFTC
jgi:hypothetical protein